MSAPVIQVAAVFMLVVGFSYMFQGRQWRRFSKDVKESPDRLFPLALLMVIFGSAVVVFHNEWTVGWELAVTVLGWVLLLKGAGLLVYPQFGGWGASLSDSTFLILIRVGGAILAAFGAVLEYRAWFAA
jgi:uncharacterized protein YjeT (DUF2065 family)